MTTVLDEAVELARGATVVVVGVAAAGRATGVVVGPWVVDGGAAATVVVVVVGPAVVVGAWVVVGGSALTSVVTGLVVVVVPPAPGSVPSGTGPVGVVDRRAGGWRLGAGAGGGRRQTG